MVQKVIWLKPVIILLANEVAMTLEKECVTLVNPKICIIKKIET